MLSRYNVQFYQNWRYNQAEFKQKLERNQQLFMQSSLPPSPIFNNLLLSVASINYKSVKICFKTKVWTKDQSLGKVAKWFEAKAEKPYACKAVGQEIKWAGQHYCLQAKQTSCALRQYTSYKDSDQVRLILGSQRRRIENKAKCFLSSKLQREKTCCMFASLFPYPHC